ncbi:hypothetical protein FBR02_04900 [Anaerolineae bacterium CFX9]|nr:hypothetical protein [Anaerolineae bacterium CFX9]
MNAVVNVLIPRRIWIEKQDAENDVCDVIVEMEDGIYYTAMFCTPPYLERQMDLSYEVSKSTADTPAVRYTTLETPHVFVPQLTMEVIEDTIDNLLSLDTFGTVFTQVSDQDGNEPDYAFLKRHAGKRASAEIAAVVLNEVLITQTDVETTEPTTVA